jgi:hypothetical protein
MGKMGLRIVYMALTLNVLLLSAIYYVRNLDPIAQVKMTTQADAVLVYGQNKLGLNSIKVFPGWALASVYLNQRNLKLPEIYYVEPIRELDVALKQSEDKKYFRIFWPHSEVGLIHQSIANPINSLINHTGDLQAMGTIKRAVLHAPDTESALLMYRYVRHHKVVQGAFGFSVSLEN